MRPCWNGTRKFWRAWGLAALAILIGPSGIWAQTIHLPSHEKVVFKNGLTVLLLEKHEVPIVNFAAVIKTGAVADPAGQGEDLNRLTPRRRLSGTADGSRRRPT